MILYNVYNVWLIYDLQGRLNVVEHGPSLVSIYR